MSREKQIEEMFNIIVDGVIDGEDNNGIPTGNTCAKIAETLYEAGYRKQSEDEWNENIIGFCNVCMTCGAIVERSAIKNNSGKLNFCPNCGVKKKRR